MLAAVKVGGIARDGKSDSEECTRRDHEREQTSQGVEGGRGAQVGREQGKGGCMERRAVSRWGQSGLARRGGWDREEGREMSVGISICRVRCWSVAWNRDPRPRAS